MLLKLTRKQRKIIELLAEGYNNEEIADELKISYYTVKNHIYLLMKKLEARDRTELVIMHYKDIINKIEGDNHEGNRAVKGS